MPEARRVALLAGGSGETGSAAAQALARAGRAVAIGYRRSLARAEACGQAVVAAGGLALTVPLDLEGAASIEEACRRVHAEWGRLDILVNCAAQNLEGPALALEDEEWQRVLNVGLTGALRLSREAARFMLPQRWGRIIHVSSIAARAGGRGQAAYAVAKAGIERLTRVLALELGRKGVTVNAVAPGVIETEMSARVRREHGAALLAQIAAGRFGTADEVAHAIAFLAPEEAAYVNGHVLAVDGGMAL